MDLTLDAFMAQLGEAGKIGEDVEAHGVLRVAELVAKRAQKEYGLSVDDAQFVLKDFVSDMDKRGVAGAEGKGRFVESYISTIAKDRDEEAVFPEAVIMDDYRELPTVLFAHQYSKLGMGMNQWIITNNNDKTAVELTHSLLAKTIFVSKRANRKADQVYQWSIEGMPIGDSIGFIPVKWIEPSDKGWDKVYDGWVKRASAFLKLKGREITDDLIDGLKRIYTKVILLEYSKVMIPSNPFAVSLAVEKGLLLESQAEIYTIEDAAATLTEQDIETPDGIRNIEPLDPEFDLFIKKFAQLTEQDKRERLSLMFAPELAAKEGRRFSAKTLSVIKTAHDALGSLLEVVEADTEDGGETDIKDIDDLDTTEEPEPTLDEIIQVYSEMKAEKEQSAEENALEMLVLELRASKGEFV